MTGTLIEDIPPEKEAVNRKRRSIFIFSVVGFCLLVSTVVAVMTGLGIAVHTLELSKILIEGLMGLAGIATVAYVGGSTIDYNGGVGNIIMPNKNDDPKG